MRIAVNPIASGLKRYVIRYIRSKMNVVKAVILKKMKQDFIYY